MVIWFVLRVSYIYYTAALYEKEKKKRNNMKEQKKIGTKISI